MVMRVLIAARLNFTQHCPSCLGSDEKTSLEFVVASYHFTTIDEKAKVWFREKRRKSPLGESQILQKALRYCNHLPKDSIETVSSERLPITAM